MVATASSIIENSFEKALAESSTLKPIPSQFTFATDSRGSHFDSIPIIDFSLLTSSNPDQRSKILHDIAQACQEWGFFVLVNHGISETLLKAIIDASLEFFELPEEEKRRYEAKSASDPIKSVINTANQRVHLWRDFVKFYVHPDFHCPQNPQSLRDTLLKFANKTRRVSKKLLQAIGENLGFEE